MSKNPISKFIRKGKERTIEIDLDVARLPSGTHITMPVRIFRSEADGPVILLSGGLHGDEVNGVEIIRQVIESEWIRKLKRGTIIALPIINVYGFIHFSRDVPDGKDVNRSFPGNPDGSLASIVASVVTQNILPVIDYGIDFHTGGASRTNYPQVRYDKDDALAAEKAKIFNAPITLLSGLINGSLRAAAKSINKSILVYEGGEAMRFDNQAIEEAILGIKRILVSENMLDVDIKKVKKSHFIESSQWVRADISGLFHFRKRSGQSVKKGEIIGSIHSPYNHYKVEVESPIKGIIIGHNNIPLVHRGDALFHIGN